MRRFFAALVFAAVSTAAFSAAPHPPTLFPLIHKLEKIRDKVVRHADPSYFEKLDLPQPGDKYLRDLTNAKHPAVIYNIRRETSDAGGVRDTLYAFVPDITQSACASYNKASRGMGRYVAYLWPVTLAPDHHTVVDDKMVLPAGIACIGTPQSHLLFAMALATRVKKSSQGDWQLEKN